MELPAALRALHLTNAQMVVVAVVGVITLVLGFKLAKTFLKLVFLLVALACLGLGLLWFLTKP